MRQDGSWARYLGNGAGAGAFIVVMGVSLLHRGFNDWAASVDAAVFGASPDRFHPTVALCAAAAALVCGALGYLMGRSLDRKRPS